MEARLGLRLSAELRTLVEAAGEPSAAARALLLLGAHAAGYDLRPLAGDVRLVLRDRSLDNGLRNELQRVLNTFNTFNTGPAPELLLDQLLREPPAPLEMVDDPLAGVGFEV